MAVYPSGPRPKRVISIRTKLNVTSRHLGYRNVTSGIQRTTTQSPLHQLACSRIGTITISLLTINITIPLYRLYALLSYTLEL